MKTTFVSSCQEWNTLNGLDLSRIIRRVTRKAFCDRYGTRRGTFETRASDSESCAAGSFNPAQSPSFRDGDPPAMGSSWELLWVPWQPRYCFDPPGVLMDDVDRAWCITLITLENNMQVKVGGSWAEKPDVPAWRGPGHRAQRSATSGSFFKVDVLLIWFYRWWVKYRHSSQWRSTFTMYVCLHT